jgi:hypothetical protein
MQARVGPSTLSGKLDKGSTFMNIFNQFSLVAVSKIISGHLTIDKDYISTDMRDWS